MKDPPYAAIYSLVEHIGKNCPKDCDECERRLGPLGNRDHIQARQRARQSNYRRRLACASFRRRPPMPR
jgi:hypothetical protein